MKYRTPLLLATLVGAALACSSSRETEQLGSSTQALSGLVAAYSFDAGSGTTAADSSGNANTGTLNGATWTTSGKYGAALTFNGANARVDVPDSASLDLTSAFTIAAWIRPTSTSGWQTLAMKEYSSSPLGLAYALYANDASARAWGGFSTSAATRSLVGGSIVANTWQHIATTFDGSTLRLYKDGTQVATAAATGPIVATTNPLRIGGNAVWGEYFAGTIDELQIYSRALSAAEVVTVRDTPLGSGTGGGTGGSGGTAGAGGSGGTSGSGGTAGSSGGTAGSSGSSGSSGGGGSGCATQLTVNGASTLQTMDGFGFSINGHSWDGGAAIPAIDLLDACGARLWRVVYEMTDWESTNDNSDPATFNWQSYNAIFTSAKFEELWSTIAYLNGKGYTNNVMLDFMGRIPNWMGGSALNNAQKDEFVETVVAAAYYGRITRGLKFGYFAPTNETDWDGIEGPQISAANYADVLNRIALRIDAIPGLADLKLIGPDTASGQNGVDNYIPAMMGFPRLMAHVPALSIHEYTPTTHGMMASIQRSTYPDRRGWVTEASNVLDAFTHVEEGASSVIMWEGFDSFYEHAVLAGRGSTIPNDAGPLPPPVAWTGSAYVTRPDYYARWQQLFRYVAPGAQRVAASSSVSGVGLLAFKDPATGRITLVGRNDGAARTLSLGLSGFGSLPGAFEFYVTSGSTQNFARQADVTVSSGRASVSVPSGSIFTLTAVPSGTDVTPPAVSLQSLTLSVNATDAVGVVGVQFVVDGVNLGNEDTSAPYSASWTAASGNHTIAIRARDAAGNSTTKNVSVTVP